MRFHVTVDQDEDGVWIVECPAIPGCVSQGQTKDEALDNIKDAIVLCLEVRAKRGMPLTIETLQINVAVNKDIEKECLRQKAEQLFQQKKWDECIPVLTEHIALEADSQLKSEVFSMRGVAYNNKGNYDRAIADFNEASRLNPNDARVFHVRGVAYYNKSNYDRAIEDFNEALRLNLDDVNDTFSYRGAAYCKKGDYDRAIEDFNEVLRLKPGDARAFSNRGFSYFNTGDYDRAIADFNEAIRLKPDRGDAFYNRGAAYIQKGEYNRAFEDFLSAKRLKSVYTRIYIATQIADIYENSSENDTGRALQLYLSLLEAISDIQKKLFYVPQQNAEVAHYTSLHTLKSLSEKGRFRLYNAAYMNDPEEGRVFFDIVKTSGIDVKNVFYRDEDQPYPSPAYIGSFVKVDELDEEKDKLFLWRTYGKHDGQEAAGACLIFEHEGTVFAKSPSAQTGAMQQLQSKPFLAEADHQIPEEKRPRKPDLYKIVYRDKENYQELSEELNEVAESLEQIKSYISEKDDHIKDKQKQLVRDLLDPIRFLFKARHYREEGEVRVVQVRYDEENTTQDEDGIHVDTAQITPRFYLKTHENFRFSEVILGPQARGVPEWKRWLKERDVKVDQSKIQYGKPYP